MCPIRVLVVDDSAFMRRQLKRMIEADRALTVVGSARDGQEALEKLREVEPDVITLDINMPNMDGLTALTHIMMERPTPCVMISSLTQEGAMATFEALELGAVDFVAKPSGTISLDIDAMEAEIVAKIKTAARARLRKKPVRVQEKPNPKPQRTAVPPVRPAKQPPIVVIGVSTGGPTTLLEILPLLPPDLPASVAIVQHMPPNFTASFAKRLNESCAIGVKEAEDGETLMPGQAYLAPGGHQMTLISSLLGHGLLVRLSGQPKGMQFCPSVDVLFDSVASTFAPRTVAVLLTGMGSDGARGMVKIRKAGGHTIAESEETAVVFGMPHEAIEMGGAEIVAPAYQIAEHIQACLRGL